MWLIEKYITDSAVLSYRQALLKSCPSYIVIDNLFDETLLGDVTKVLTKPEHWKTQQHTYSALYVDNAQWKSSSKDQRFVQRDAWQQKSACSQASRPNAAQQFLAFLRSEEFMSVLSRIFKVQLTDVNVAEPEQNTNYFRLGPNDFVEQHADDSPNREVCMLLYLNKNWQKNTGGELSFAGKEDGQPIQIQPLYNRCVLFDPSSTGSEHWVEKLNTENTNQYRYNVTSWYWSE